MNQTDTHHAAATTAPSDAEAMRRTGGAIGILGAVVMMAGAVTMFASDNDWLTAAGDRSMAGFLTGASGDQTVIYLHLALWILGATLMALAVTMIASASRLSALAVVARFSSTAAAGAVMVFFPMVIGVVYALRGMPDQEPLANAMGAAAAFSDDVATVMIVGVGATTVAFAGRGDWAPRWLLRLAVANGVVAALYFLPVEPIATITGTLLVVTGEVLVICLGVVGLRGRSRQAG